jgi:hypothetical protein
MPKKDVKDTVLASKNQYFFTLGVVYVVSLCKSLAQPHCA